MAIKIIRFILPFCPLFVSILAFAQGSKDSEPVGIQFSGTFQINTNGIATVPAFTLDKPAVVGVLSLNKKRFGIDQYLAYSIEGKPWFIESYFNYKIADGKKIALSTAAMWGASFTYDRVFSAGIWQETTEYQRYVFLIQTTSYKLSPKNAINLSTYHGYGFPEGSIRWATFVTLVGNLPEAYISESVYLGIFPQLLFINLDWETDAFFLAGKFGVRHKKLPLFFSTQISKPFAGNLSPDPGFQWNIGLAYNF